MPVKILKLAKELLACPISVLINNSFLSGTFPKLLKIAHITPIFKGQVLLSTHFNYARYLKNIRKVNEISPY
jgi:hypothetical protein